MKTIFITIIFSAAIHFLLAQTSEFNTNEKQIAKKGESVTGLVSEPEIELKSIASMEVNEEIDFVNITRVYPNPANKDANFDFEWNQHTTEAKIVIYNLLGTIVREVELRDNVSRVKIDTENLVEGIYFYSLVVKNRPTITQKLIIRH
jgi:hypothetical protein